MSVIVHTGNPNSPILLFAEADTFRPVDEFGRDLLTVLKGDQLIASFRNWDSAAIVDDATAAAFGRMFPCQRCNDREARLREAVAARATPKSSDD